MRTQALASAVEGIRDLVGVPPPVSPYVLRGGTQLTGRWQNGSFEGRLPPLSEHVIAATYAGGVNVKAVIDGKKVSLAQGPGVVTIAPRGQGGAWSINGNIEVSNVLLSQDRLASCADQLAEGRTMEIQARVGHSDPKLFQLMKLLCDEIEWPQMHSTLFLEHAIDLVCLQLLRSHSTLGTLAFKPQKGLAHWQVRRVISYMREHIGTDITLQDLANVVSMSRFHFCGAFRAATGVPPHEYLTRMRMKVACDLLEHSGLHVKDVGHAVGYTTSSAFTSAFHRIMRCTPSQYRRHA
ncbi:AraC family transcriptional regulator [Pseudoxanthomonas sp. SL93]|uniref:helix-turn-helix domain-containing protein n=1 Tax=Pseudoxanthomonas sp. SL93 TaxID=2995142 RepID=UPI0022714D82|nr:AraC family transcriptional regulator [Pseudoxanthomonas sp. SL93]WAC64033.1 AraC family transcriptional regulator [Pseudoxanthomonas sp. SL93]